MMIVGRMWRSRAVYIIVWGKGTASSNLLLLEIPPIEKSKRLKSLSPPKSVSLTGYSASSK